MTARIEVQLSQANALIPYLERTGPALQNAGLAYAFAGYGGAPNRFALCLWLGPRPVAVAFILPPEPPP